MQDRHYVRTILLSARVHSVFFCRGWGHVCVWVPGPARYPGAGAPLEEGRLTPGAYEEYEDIGAAMGLPSTPFLSLAWFGPRRCESFGTRLQLQGLSLQRWLSPSRTGRLIGLSGFVLRGSPSRLAPLVTMRPQGVYMRSCSARFGIRRPPVLRA